MKLGERAVFARCARALRLWVRRKVKELQMGGPIWPALLVTVLGLASPVDGIRNAPRIQRSVLERAFHSPPWSQWLKGMTNRHTTHCPMVFSGPSGVGKGTLIQAVLEVNFHALVSRSPAMSAKVNLSPICI